MKKDQKRNKTEKALSYFPNINRFITEEWKLIISSLISTVIIFGIIFQSIRLYENLQKQKEVVAMRSELEQERDHWQEQLEKYPEHRDIYFKIAKLEYSLGNENEARMNLDKALKLDPNFEEARNFDQKIGVR